ncbi:MAG: hypothetical protein H0X34_18465 [Chthoniobacterales bacterium]|jgi:hypothetical protein|nr:hypothetical protein [Chthoniobacterales bacterium]
MIPQGEQKAESGHEHQDADVPGVVLVGALVLLIVAISFFTARGMLDVARDRGTAEPAHRGEAHFPQPHLEVHPGADLAESKRGDEVELGSYGWIDRKAGVVRIPVERAIQLLMERGLPDVGAGQTRLQLMQARPSADTQPKQPVGSPAPEGSP